jgi:hypothetical protein
MRWHAVPFWDAQQEVRELVAVTQQEAKASRMARNRRQPNPLTRGRHGGAALDVARAVGSPEVVIKLASDDDEE